MSAAVADPPTRLDPGAVEGLVDLSEAASIDRRSRRAYSRRPFDHAPSADDPGAFDRGLSALARRLADVLPRKGLVLEAGSGPGHMTAWLKARGVPVLALDQSAASLVILRSRVDAPAVVADVTALPFPDGAFAAVLADGVVHHSRAPGVALRELVRVLARGGTLFLRTYRAESRYPVVYRTVGAVLRALESSPPLDRAVWRYAFPAYRRAADRRYRARGEEPGRHDEAVFADYFLSPHATPARGSTLFGRLRRLGLEVLEYERYRNSHGFLARKRGAP